jgi:tRNA pseudouridine13 synthase
MMEKRGLETFSLLSYLSKANGIPFRDIGYAGLKDRHAVTRQMITVPSSKEIRTLHEKSFDMEFKGYSDSPLTPGQLRGNRFTILARDLSDDEAQRAKGKAGLIRKLGVPNYFDSQRFGSVPHGEFIARHLMEGDFESAMKVHLTHYDKKEKRQVKEDKRAIQTNWGNLKKAKVRSKHLQTPIETFLRTGSWESAYLTIAQNMREMFLSAYQSHIWNECVKGLLADRYGKERLEEVRYSLGTLLFFKDLDVKDLEGLPKDLPVIGKGAVLWKEEESQISKVLEREGIALEAMKDLDIAGDHMRSYRRDVIMRPEDLSVSGPQMDELNSRPGKERSRLTVSFQISKGSYGTVIIKGLFGV